MRVRWEVDLGLPSTPATSLGLSAGREATNTTVVAARHVGGGVYAAEVRVGNGGSLAEFNPGGRRDDTARMNVGVLMETSDNDLVFAAEVRGSRKAE